MGILNVTPDSFADGGRYVARDAAIRRVDDMVAEGVDIVDVGGESTRPRGKTYGSGATPVSAKDEIERVVPVIREATRRHPRLTVSIDTYKSDVARAALDAGACMINDVTGARFDPDIASAAAEGEIPLVLMHSVGNPGSMPHATAYEDVVADVRRSLEESISVALQRGVRSIIVDPGFGFGKRVTENLELIGRLGEFSDLGRPILIGISRKSSIGSVLSDTDDPVPVQDRLFGSLGAAAAAIMQGAAILRVHDVGATRDVARVVDAILATRRREEVHA